MICVELDDCGIKVTRAAGKSILVVRKKMKKNRALPVAFQDYRK
jgi:hypothetical protein